MCNSLVHLNLGYYCFDIFTIQIFKYVIDMWTNNSYKIDILTFEAIKLSKLFK